MLGGGIFGDIIFADLNGLSEVRRRGRGIGGSGFPDNWYDIIAANAAQAERERRRLERELEEVVALVAAGIL